MRNASGQQDENERQWEKKANRNTSNKIFVSTYNIFSIKRVTSKFQVATTMAEKCTKKCAAGAKLFFCWLDLMFFVLPFSLPTPFGIARFHVYEYMLLVKTPVIDVNAT